MENHIKRIESSSNLSLIIEVNQGMDGLCKLGLNDEHVAPDGAVYFDDSPFELEIRCKTSVVGSCNGLVCLFRKNNWVAIWNPSARTLHELPPMPIKFFGLENRVHSKVYYGFGHDRSTNDYKVIGIAVIHRRHGSAYLGIESRVYSMKTKSWAKKSLSFTDKNLGYFESGTFASISNSLYWIMDLNKVVNLGNQHRYFIGGFDLGINNGYHEVQLPNLKLPKNNGSSNYEQPENLPRTLGVLRGCLCVFTTSRDSSDLWVMKETWTRLISFTDPCLDRLNMMIKPLAYSRSGDKVLVHEYDSKLLQSNLIWYNLRRSKKVEVARFEENLCVDVAEKKKATTFFLQVGA